MLQRVLHGVAVMVAVTCSVMQRDAVCFSDSQCFEACCKGLPYVSQCVLQRLAVCCSRFKMCCNVLQCAAVCVAVCCSVDCSDVQCNAV